MARPFARLSRLSLTRCLVLMAALALGAASATPAFADDHHGWHHEDRDHDRDFHHFHRGPSFGLFFGAPAYIPPPPVYYAPAYPPSVAYPYAPVPITGIYASPYGYCRDFRTGAGIETACQQPDGVWRFIN